MLQNERRVVLCSCARSRLEYTHFEVVSGAFVLVRARVVFSGKCDCSFDIGSICPASVSRGDVLSVARHMFTPGEQRCSTTEHRRPLLSDCIATVGALSSAFVLVFADYSAVFLERYIKISHALP